MKKYAVIVAGGSGLRMGTDIPKQFILLNRKPLLWYTLEAFLSAYNDMQIILVLPKENIPQGESISKDTGAAARINITAGGTTRFHSVQNGLALIANDISVVFVHDGVRCLVTKELIQRCYKQAIEKGSAIPAVAATDSIRIIEDNAHSVADRNKVRIIQTPQTFLSTLLIPAFNTSYQPAYTDEATVVEASGKEVFLVEGDYENIKITRPTDLLIAEKILAERSAFQ
jgi:2-C-methyl-D-erythritol 4-phosphate cytidylyltransferase